ncbi:hypothetical protein VaNZ11_002154 [Volvox africanus]|uniref:Methyltransferase small domain-containing protein n=1 Tax=Volvox africanus TaxID=51714 RepID=A0ABQ5RRA5_9CHLO|nr:hypothetical protein VaNZ11_002154 [Volvox africanus]
MEGRKAKRARAEPATTAQLADSEYTVSGFLRSWAWKREHRPDRDRFQRPYVHSLKIPKSGPTEDEGIIKLTIEQTSFRGAEGFASTVWDSSIVVAKLLERNPDLVVGRAVLDLSAGCGLAAIAAARLGARHTVATDLGPNLPLLRRNCERNGAAVDVMEHWWGSDTTPLLQGGGFSSSRTEAPTDLAMKATQAAASPNAATSLAEAGAAAAASEDASGGYRGREGEAAECGEGRLRREVQERRGEREGLDLVIACDVMYQEAAMGSLVATLAALCGGEYDGNGGSTAAASATTKGVSMKGNKLQGHDKNAAASGLVTAKGATADPDAGTEADVKTEAEAEAAPLSSSAGVMNVCKDPVPASAAPGPRPTAVLLAHGRNRFAEAVFWRHAAAAGFRVEAVRWDDLDPVYRCTDVDVYWLRLEGEVS